ncbi:MAG: potassium transporter [Proteobacteria bacterium]|nr:MAG: potassium transporter [Pseudomonadota bacterium]
MGAMPPPERTSSGSPISSRRRLSCALTCGWLLACLAGACPYYFSGVLPTFTDALFESVSGFSCTGATLIEDIEGVDGPIVLWRSMTQWLGGMGIILFFVAVLPLLGFGGVELFKAEVAGPQKDKITPRVRDTAKKLWLIYLSLTVLLFVLLLESGMGAFDGLNHALTTVSSGGFSSRNNGIASFDNAVLEFILAIFMLLAAVNFTLLYRFIVQRDYAVFSDTELTWYMGALGVACLSASLMLYFGPAPSLQDALRYGFFSVASSISSTGFYSAPHISPPSFLQLLIVLLIVMGGMSGSTAGGVKCIRLVAALKQLVKQLRQVVHPSAVMTIKANEQPIPESIVNAIWGLIFLFFLVFSIAAGILTIEGYDLVTASSAAFASLSNVGPSLSQLSPGASYAEFSLVSKLTLAACMLLGRLEFFTVLVLLTPAYWRR